MSAELPRPGQVMLLNRAASVQFDGDRALTVRVLGIDEGSTQEGWIWLTVVVLGPTAARERAAIRTVFVRRAGLRPRPDLDLLWMPERGVVTSAERAEPEPQLLG